MTDRIEIEFRPSEGAILRLIGLVERRGFEVRGVDLPQMNTQSDARMDLMVQPRDADLLALLVTHQLRAPSS